jgi:hypothetical protein
VCERLVKSDSEHRAPLQIARFYQCAECGYSERAA